MTKILPLWHLMYCKTTTRSQGFHVVPIEIKIKMKYIKVSSINAYVFIMIIFTFNNSMYCCVPVGWGFQQVQPWRTDRGPLVGKSAIGWGDSYLPNYTKGLAGLGQHILRVTFMLKIWHCQK